MNWTSRNIFGVTSVVDDDFSIERGRRDSLLSGDNGGSGGDIDEMLPDTVLSGRMDKLCMPR